MKRYEYERTTISGHPWQPVPPDGDGWRLHSVKESEDWIAFYWEREVTE